MKGVARGASWGRTRRRLCRGMGGGWGDCDDRGLEMREWHPYDWRRTIAAGGAVSAEACEEGFGGEAVDRI